ncbi:hypothetical protein HNR46_003065 [Haloferula luteola]|uniref:Uncharacterized protein n=1 Tax=Haloferula luteola TaxID=595692 RepID=A0A840V3E2_9BACT|nr:hypothetical protein [Haloferula luteola]MBB5352817.1 hypothetical protein [Haloferula luteola]
MDLPPGRWARDLQPETPPSPEPKPYRLTAHLPHRLNPSQLRSRYVTPIDEALSQQHLGKTAGGGTSRSITGEIESVDLEIEIHDLTHGIPVLISTLERQGAPKGSILHFQDKTSLQEFPFGHIEGIGLYLDDLKLSGRVYQKYPLSDVIDQLAESLAGHGELQGHWRGDTQTALYFYGNHAEAMTSRLQQIIPTHPRCQGARIVRITPE